MGIFITAYNTICNLGYGMEEIYQNACRGDISKFTQTSDIIKNTKIRIGKVSHTLPKITKPDYNTRCNRLVLACFELMKKDFAGLISKYGKDNIAIVCATTNTGVEEFEKSQNPKHFEIGNPSEFAKDYLGLNNFATTVSTACSSGIKAFSIANQILNSNIAEATIVIGVDSIAKLPLFGFHSLEILSPNPTNPFSKNRSGINIGEGAAVFILEKEKTRNSIEICSIGETTDVYHATCPDPKAKEVINAINQALTKAQISPQDIDYINLHGTGTISNEIMEANAIYSIFKDQTLCSSTKPLTGHCLGAASSIETALCCKLIQTKNPIIYPHIYDGNYDKTLPKIKLVNKNYNAEKISHCLCTAFGFGGTNAVIILGEPKNE